MNKFENLGVESLEYSRIGGRIPLGSSVYIASKQNPEKMLVVHRRDDYSKVCIPGGKHDLGESSVVAAVREAKEETGIDFKEEELFPILSDVCESDSKMSDEFWVTAYLVLIDEDRFDKTKLTEPELNPEWVTRDYFLTHSAYPIFNKKLILVSENFLNFNSNILFVEKEILFNNDTLGISFNGLELEISKHTINVFNELKIKNTNQLLNYIKMAPQVLMEKFNINEENFENFCKYLQKILKNKVNNKLLFAEDPDFFSFGAKKP